MFKNRLLVASAALLLALFGCTGSDGWAETSKEDFLAIANSYTLDAAKAAYSKGQCTQKTVSSVESNGLNSEMKSLLESAMQASDEETLPIEAITERHLINEGHKLEDLSFNDAEYASTDAKYYKKDGGLRAVADIKSEKEGTTLTGKATIVCNEVGLLTLYKVDMVGIMKIGGTDATAKITIQVEASFTWSK